MKKYTPVQLIRMLGAPAATVLLGLVLLFSPDTASALVGKLLGWCAILAALGLGAVHIPLSPHAAGADGKQASPLLPPFCSCLPPLRWAMPVLLPPIPR